MEAVRRTDDYTNNLDELTLATNTAPSVTASATQVSPVTIDPVAAEATTISTTFTDTDQPGVGGFTVTFRVREPDNATEVTLVNNQPNGGGGLTITDNGGGSYTASYDWDPGAAQTAGTYDLFFEVSDGLATATDDQQSPGRDRRGDPGRHLAGQPSGHEHDDDLDDVQRQ